MLDDLDTVDWSALTHRDGSADDVPELLRDLAAGEDPALLDLLSTIVDFEEIVYEAAAFAVPFLVRIADAPDADAPGVLRLLALIAGGGSFADRYGHYGVPRSQRDTAEARARRETERSWVAAAHAAVAEALPTYTRLLADHPDAKARAAAARIIGLARRDAHKTGAASLDRGTTEALWHAARSDDDEVVRATAIFALGTVGETVEECLSDSEAVPRLVAAVVVAAAASPADGREAPTEALVKLIEVDAAASIETFPEVPMGRYREETLIWVVNRLDAHWKLQVDLLTAWLRHPDDAVRGLAAHAAVIPMQTWRPAAARLVPELGRALSDPCEEVRKWARSYLHCAGRAAAAVADELWTTVEHETWPLTALSRLQDPRADAHIARRLSAVPGDGEPLHIGGLLEAIGVLGPWAVATRDVIVDAIERVEPGDVRSELIIAAGRVAAPVDKLLPVLRRQASSHPHATSLLVGDLGPAAREALPELTALREHPDAVVRANAARAIWRITGDLDGLLVALRAGLDMHRALEVLAEVGPAGSELAPLLPPMFDADDEWHALWAAVAYWRRRQETAPARRRRVRSMSSRLRPLVSGRLRNRYRMPSTPKKA
uniref:Putative HEAT domain-containing protein n=1 Tax=Dactylosporangium aurantiacum subsp. hamdenensis TaxID=703577 RepID=E9LIR3_9ACTN|nr:putative HEAT domain-containing protein [Dactylosporangium aurantiacum subsp. hamdenensis]